MAKLAAVTRSAILIQVSLASAASDQQTKIVKVSANAMLTMVSYFAEKLAALLKHYSEDEVFGRLLKYQTRSHRLSCGSRALNSKT